MYLKEIIPAFYQNILPEKILKIEVTETKATCHNCLRSRDNRFAYTYKKNLKCCTFHPFLPNFAVGALLNLQQNLQLNLNSESSINNSKKSSGIAAIENKIANKEFNLPLGILAPFEYQFKFLNKEETDFGNDESLLCPYYDRIDNQCSIWQYRGVVCTSFYCRSDYGQNGLKFWAVLSDYLSYVEMALAEECLVQLDFSPRDLSDQLMYLNKFEFEANEVSQTTIDNTNYKLLWNAYADKPEFYKKCFSLVENLNRSEFKVILGQQGLNLEKEVIEYANKR